jgi:hypothetical protein
MIRFARCKACAFMLIDIVNEGICLYCPRLVLPEGGELSGPWLLDRAMTGKSSTYKSFLELMVLTFLLPRRNWVTVPGGGNLLDC